MRAELPPPQRLCERLRCRQNRAAFVDPRGSRQVACRGPRSFVPPLCRAAPNSHWHRGSWRDPQDLPDPSHGPSEATVNSHRPQRAVFQAGPRAQRLRLTVQVVGSGRCIDCGTSFAFEGWERPTRFAFPRFSAGIRCGLHDEFSRTSPNGKAWKPIVFIAGPISSGVLAGG